MQYKIAGLYAITPDLEDTGDNRKAMIEFEGLGQKTLVLKFAKLMIHP